MSTDITTVNLSALDLNLFLVLHALLVEQSATRAARRLHVTQSAVSNALSRLREALGDPLFVRSGRGLAPTSVAVALRPDVEAAIAHLERATAAARGFDPTTATRTFRITLADYQELTDLPRIFALLTARAPCCSLEVVPIERSHAEGGLERGSADVAIGPRAAGEGLRVHPLYVEQGTLIVRRDHPDVGDRVDRDEFARLRQVVVHVGGRPSVGNKVVDEHLQRAGLTRTVRLTVPHFLAAARVVAESDAVALIPGRLAALLARDWPLRTVGLPFDPPSIPVAMGWAARTDADPGARLLREVVIEALADG